MRPTAVLFALVMAVPTTLIAQEEETPPATVLTISSYQCSQAAIADITEGYDQFTRPVEEELVEEGALVSAGLFFHQWADEWNVNYYRTGYDLSEVLEAIAEVGRRVNERNPELADGPGLFAACTAHKDGIYNFGPGTGRTTSPDGDN